VVKIYRSQEVPRLFAHEFVGEKLRYLTATYLVTMSVNQLFWPLYFTLCDSNLLQLRPDRSWSLVYLCQTFLTLQLLYMQVYSGPRCFIPVSLRNTYQYMRKTPKIDSTTEEEKLCAVCLTSVYLLEEERSEEFLETPCEHTYHKKCLL